jgi:hypothetical protein
VEVGLGVLDEMVWASDMRGLRSRSKERRIERSISMTQVEVPLGNLQSAPIAGPLGNGGGRVLWGFWNLFGASARFEGEGG